MAMLDVRESEISDETLLWESDSTAVLSAVRTQYRGDLKESRSAKIEFLREKPHQRTTYNGKHAQEHP
ncbi:hypothetical protein E4U30_002048 [Claviceps sp. LM220 group G6]|nr:hypothetical protein E4U30_002048 [Claviceps sp. LM220 group G6]